MPVKKTVDTRGLSCPQPVLALLGEIRSGNYDEIEILIDTETSVENVTRATRKEGWSVAKQEAQGGFYILTVKKRE